MKITIHKNGTCTIRGVDARLFESLLVRAELYHHDSAPEAHRNIALGRQKANADTTYLAYFIRRNIQTSLTWYRDMRRLVHDLKQLMHPDRVPEVFRDDHLRCGICGAPLENGVCFREQKALDQQ